MQFAKFTSSSILDTDVRMESDYEKLQELDDTYGFRSEYYQDDDTDIGVSMISIN